MIKDKCICPICGKEVNNMLPHIKIHHEYKIYNSNDFYKYFPNYNGKLHIDKRIKGEYICTICGKKYEYNNGLMVHYKARHPEYYNELKTLKQNSHKCV